MSGYQSDIDLQDITFVGDFPIEHSIGGYGETTGATDDYALTLNPPISQYRIGMHLQVMFSHANAGVSTLDVDAKGDVPLQKVVNGALADLGANDLNTIQVYDLVFDGTCFQVVTGINSPSGNSEPNLGNPTGNGQVLSSQIDGARAWVDKNTLLFKFTGTVSEPLDPGLGEVVIPPAYVLPAGELQQKQGLKIRLNGFFREFRARQLDSVEKTLRVYIGNAMVLSNTNVPNPHGNFAIEIIVYRITTTILKGYGRLYVNGEGAEIKTIQTGTLAIDTTDTPIQVTAQNPAGDSGQGALITRFMFTVEKLV